MLYRYSSVMSNRNRFLLPFALGTVFGFALSLVVVFA